MKKIVLTILLSTIIWGISGILDIGNISATETTIIDLPEESFSLTVVSEDVIILSGLNLNVEITIDDFIAYRILDGDLTIDHHFKYDDIHIIIPPAYSTDVFRVRAIYGDEQETGETNINSYVFGLISRNSVNIEKDSELAQTLRSMTLVFEDNHYKDISEPISIKPFTLERNYKTIEQMTKTDLFLNAYEPAFQYFGQGRAIHDSIINLVPESWFYNSGTYSHVGDEYAVLVQTKYVKHHGYDLYLYATDVSIFDIETSLPFYSANLTDGGSSSQYYYTKNYLMSVEPAFQVSYYSYEKRNVNQEWWYLNFDSSEEKVIAARIDIAPNIYIVPTFNTLLVDYGEDVTYNGSGHHTWGIDTYTYELKTEVNQQYVNSEIFRINCRSVIFDGLAAISEVVFPKLGKPLALGLSTIDNFLATYDLQQLNANIDKVTYSAEDKNFHVSFSGRPLENVLGQSYLQVPYPYLATVGFGKYNDVFNNPALGNYKHLFKMNLVTRLGLQRDDYTSIIDVYKFNFCYPGGTLVKDNSGSDIEKTRVRQYEKLSHERGNEPATPIGINSYFNRNIDATRVNHIVDTKATTNGAVKVTITAPTAVNGYKVDIYSQLGHLINTIETNNSNNKKISMMNLEFGNFYTFVIEFKNYKSGNISITFTPPSSYNMSTQSTTTIPWVSDNTIKDYYKLTFPYPGTYVISAYSSNDTTARLYDSNGNLLYESTDPFYDPNEDSPILYAQFRYRFRGYNSVYYLEVDLEGSGKPYYTSIYPFSG